MAEVKRFTAELKDATTSADGKLGLVTMAVSVFGNVDHCGDRVMPGAFKNDIAAWEQCGRPQPVVWSHDWADPKSFVGETVSRNEENFGDGKTGLVVKQQYDITKPPEMSNAAQVFDLVARGLVYQASYAYTVVRAELVDPEPGESTPRKDGKIRNLLELKTFENGPTLLGMNDQTETLEAASRASVGTKVGRALSADNETKLQDAYDLIGEVLSTVAGEEDGGTEVASDTPESKALDFDTSLAEADASRAASFSRLWQLEYAFEDTVLDIKWDGSADPEADLEAAIAQFGTALSSWGQLFLGIVPSDEGEEGEGEMVGMMSLRSAIAKSRAARESAFKGAADAPSTVDGKKAAALLTRTRYEEE